MDNLEAATILSSMVSFIRTHGHERVETINKQASEEFTVEKEKFIAEEKERISAEIKERLRKDEINLKIDRSKQENVLRIEKMRTINELILKLFRDARVSIVKKQEQDKNKYAELLKNLIVQGLIKLMEPEVNVRCRKSDLVLIKSVVDKASEEYKALMKAEVKGLKNKEIPLKINVDEHRFLPEFLEKSVNPTESCMGGVVMHAKLGRIVCSNTLDERLILLQQEAIPQIREGLFPCLIREAKPDHPVEHHEHH